MIIREKYLKIIPGILLVRIFYNDRSSVIYRDYLYKDHIFRQESVGASYYSLPPNHFHTGSGRMEFPARRFNAS